MQIDSFDYPHNDNLVETHIRSNRIGKIRSDLNSIPIHQGNAYNPSVGMPLCPHCQRSANDCPKFKLCESEPELQKRYGIYGPNCVIYLGVIRRLGIFMLILSVLIGVPLIVLNLLGKYCSQLNGCVSKSLAYNWSLYNVLGLNPGSFPHTIIWFIFCILLILFSIYIRKYTMQTYRKINARNTTDSDYCLLLRRLPIDTRPQDVYDVFSFINTQKNLQLPFNQANGSPIKNILMINKADEFVKAHQNSVKEFKQQIQDDRIQNYNRPKFINPTNKQFASAAIVRFFEKTSNNKIKQTIQESICEKLKNYFCIFYNEKTQYTIAGQQISIQNAPHPTDMQWKNFGYGQCDRILRKILLNISALIILFISSGITLGISFWIRKLTNTSGSQPIYLTILIVLITLAFNVLIRKIIIHSTKLMRLDTYTDEQSQQISLLVVHQSLNLGFFSIIAPIIAQLPDFVKEQTKKSSNFPSVMLTTIITQAIVANIAHFLVYYHQIKQKIARMLHNRRMKVKTQTEAFEAFKGLEIPFTKGYAFAIKLFWFGFIYGVVTPISIPIAAIGLIMFHIFEKILYNKVYSIPVYTGPRINYEMVDMLDWTPFLIGAFNLFLYQTSKVQRGFESDGRIMGLIIAMMAIGIVHLLVPWKDILKNCIKTHRAEQTNYVHNPYDLQITFEESDPQTRPTSNIIYRQQRISDRNNFHSGQRITVPNI